MTTQQQELIGIQGVIRAADNGEDIDAVTETVIAIILDEHRRTAEELLYQPVRSFIRAARRRAERAKEDEAFRERRPEPEDKGRRPRPEPENDRLAAMRALRAEEFWCPGYGLVTWGKATAEQHLAHADSQRGRAATITIDAERHEEAADIIEDAGVECLNEVPGY